MKVLKSKIHLQHFMGKKFLVLVFFLPFLFVHPLAMAQTQKKEKKAPKKRVIQGKSEKCRVNWNMKFQPDLKDATIVDIIKLVAKRTCQNFILGGRINLATKFVMIAESKISLGSFYKAFFEALRSNDLTAVRSGSFWKIIQSSEGIRSEIKTYTSGRFTHAKRPELVTYLYQVKHIQANAAANPLRQLISKGASITFYEPTNTLIITAFASNIYRLLAILKKIDVKQAESRERIYVLSVFHAQARDIAARLQSLFQVGKPRNKVTTRRRTVRIRGRNVVQNVKVKTSDNSFDEEDFRLAKLVADERTNQIIVLCSKKALARVKKLVKDLDVALPGDGQIWVHYLKFASSDELSQTLSNIVQGTKKQTAVRGRKPVSGKKKASELFDGEVKVTSDKATNSLVVIASKRDFESLLKVIKDLDVPRKQVFIEIVILELSMNKSKDLGLAFHKLNNVSSDPSQPIAAYGSSSFPNANSMNLNLETLSGLAFGLTGQKLAELTGIAGLKDLPSFGVFLRAMQTNSDVDIISTPHILTTANETAKMVVGQNVPYVAGTLISAGLSGTAGLSGFTGQNIQRQDVALSVEMKPQVDAGDYIRMDFKLELSELAGDKGNLGPVISKRQLSTIVLAKNNQTVVIGGLVRDKVTHAETKIPLLGDIPLLGKLFKSSTKSSEKRNLLVFLTPYIINTDEDFKAIFRKKMKERQKFLKLLHRKKSTLPLVLKEYQDKAGLFEKVSTTLEKGKKEAKEMEKKQLSSAKESMKKRSEKKKKTAQMDSKTAIHSSQTNK